MKCCSMVPVPSVQRYSQMSQLSRIGVAIDSQLLEKFDALIEKKGYTNRSEAFRDLIRDDLMRQETASPDADVVGTITLIYDHHVRTLSDRLMEIQHQHHHEIVSVLHVHLNHDSCLEVLIVRGKAIDLQKLSDLLIATKGVQHGKLSMTVASPASSTNHSSSHSHS